jgi:acyl CoA:acetate/3-ketoacid CoA transferase
MFRATGWILDEREIWKHEEVLAFVHPQGVVHEHYRHHSIDRDCELG